MPSAALAVDTTPPQLVAFDFTPKTVNVSSSSQTVTLTMRITDNSSGVQQPYVSFRNQTTAQSAWSGVSLVSGTVTDVHLPGHHHYPA